MAGLRFTVHRGRRLRRLDAQIGSVVVEAVAMELGCGGVLDGQRRKVWDCGIGRGLPWWWLEHGLKVLCDLIVIVVFDAFEIGSAGELDLL
ncbi:hypothetical protein M0R45_026491 [Rubus argutus]|uniref:Uncharacterized protein n=1 Tax=Rubus argutus TaxID=59490 RepID=A0AAW1WZ01_RUBAR